MNMLLNQLAKVFPQERIKSRLIDRYAYASDASHFYLLPKVVVQPKNVGEVQALFEIVHRLDESVTFRAAGTSFSGQGVTDGILADLSNFWRSVIALDHGKRVKVEPGVIGAHVNLALKKYGKKIGPDPASINACMMGGILSNNSSGMCCGVKNNAYHTLQSLTFVLPNGQMYNTANREDYTRFEIEAKELFNGIAQLKHNVRENPSLVARIRKKYKQKNTVGYCINAFLDYDHPLDILAHVIIGGEGTLAFIAEATLNTIPDLPYKMTGMLFFENPKDACDAIFKLKMTGAEALEFMDRASLKSIECMPGVPAFIRDLPPTAAAILCEFQETSPDTLQDKFTNASSTFKTLPLIREPSFTLDDQEQALLWKIRKGMYPSVAGMRSSGASTLLEDFTLPVERLGDAVVDIQQLFEKYEYHTGIIFGHAKDGNLHFAISLSFATPEEVDHYEKFNDELFSLILEKYDGALKGEHSTGRAVSAYVEKEWGPDAYHIMKKLKALIDPNGILNPGIIITQDEFTHIHHLKVMPVVDSLVDKCIECGFCENKCPSRDVTLTPRRRIAVRRAMERLSEAGDLKTRAQLEREYKYDGVATCAVDGMCETACPVDINTGDLVKKLREDSFSDAAKMRAVRVASNFAKYEKVAKLGTELLWKARGLLGSKVISGTNTLLRKFMTSIPRWYPQMERPAKTKQMLRRASSTEDVGQPRIIYFSSCVNRMMGNVAIQSFFAICERAGIKVILNQAVAAACCGQIFSSKGYNDAFRETVNNNIEPLFDLSDDGKIPIVVDTTSCTQTIMNWEAYLSENDRAKFKALTILDVVDFIEEHVLPRLTVSAKKDKVALHPVCSSHKLQNVDRLNRIGEWCAREVFIPDMAGCCGMAGDRGMLYPELTRSATRREAHEVNQRTFDGYYSTSKTCEMAMSEATRQTYQSILLLVDEVTR